MLPSPKNAPEAPLTRFCLALERYRRREEGAVRTDREMLLHFFPYDAKAATDRFFLHVPREVRGTVLAAWGIRGIKSAQRDDDDRVRTTIHDALLAGDIDEAAFEEGVTPELLTAYAALDDWWRFFRGEALDLAATRKALAVARQEGLFDEAWLLANVASRRGALRGIEALAEPLRKDQMTAWIRGVHREADASAAGIVAALGWETLLETATHEALLFALDALAKHVGIVLPPIVAAPVAPPAPLATATAPVAPSTVVVAPPAPAKPAEDDPLMDSELRAMFDSVKPPAQGSASAPIPPPSLPLSVGAAKLEALVAATTSAPPMLPAGADEEADIEGDDFESFTPPPDESWWPERAEPGDMGFDLAYGIGKSMATNVRPSYDFDKDDGEPTRDIQLPKA